MQGRRRSSRGFIFTVGVSGVEVGIRNGRRPFDTYNDIAQPFVFNGAATKSATPEVNDTIVRSLASSSSAVRRKMVWPACRNIVGIAWSAFNKRASCGVCLSWSGATVSRPKLKVGHQPEQDLHVPKKQSRIQSRCVVEECRRNRSLRNASLYTTQRPGYTAISGSGRNGTSLSPSTDEKAAHSR